MEYLNRQLLEKNVRVAELARALGVAPQVVTNWKSRGVPASRFRDLATALDVPIEEVEIAYRGRVLPKPLETEAQRRLKEIFSDLTPDQQRAVLQIVEAFHQSKQ